AFFERITSVVVTLETGEIAEDIDPEIFDQRKAQKDPATSQVAPDNNAGINRIPDHAVVFQVFDDQNALDMVILPVEGYGLWGTLYGFIALSSDFQTVRGLTYYEHKETPGLGGEVDNPRWKGLWPGRKIFGEDGMPEIEVIKGAAGPVADAPYEVDGLSGATITSRGITNMLHFWLGEQGFGAYLDKLRASTESTQRRAA
ncbi:MAG: NADH:ubiquinone reductase (Na(+)-transporting) subunit C, partial [Acidobacteriota bacterium]